MKIAILGIRGIPAHYGGFETNTDITARELAKRGHEVVVYCRGFRRGRPKVWEDVHLKYLPSIESKSLSTISHTFVSAISCCFRHFDIVHLYNVGNAFLIPMLRLFGKKVVISVDGVEWRRKKYGVFSSMWMHISEKFAKWFAQKIIVDSLKVGEYYQNRYNADTVYIPYGSAVSKDVRRSGFLEEYGLEPKKYILFVGRFIPDKGIDKLLEAYSRIRTDMPLVVVGDNPYDAEYVALLKSKAPPGTVFTGAVYGDRVKELYRESYLFISPSELEGTSPALLEAMGAGTCVVVNGIPEQLETIGDAGVYYKVNDLDDLTRKLQRLIDEPKIRDAYAEKARMRVREYYRWDRIIDYYEAMLAGTAGIDIPLHDTANAPSPFEADRRKKVVASDIV